MSRRWLLLPIAIVGVMLFMTLRTCTAGERLVGPSVGVQNDSGRAIVVRLGTGKWPVGLGEIRGLRPYFPYSFINATVTFEILDAASCQTMGTIAVDFGANHDAWIVVPPSGPATVAQLPTEGRVGQGDANAAPDVCATQPTDGVPGSPA
jgi:hypothetical protein